MRSHLRVHLVHVTPPLTSSTSTSTSDVFVPGKRACFERKFVCACQRSEEGREIVISRPRCLKLYPYHPLVVSYIRIVQR